jgi:hypothetical protein
MKSQQTTSTVFMIQPVRFGYNPQTAGNNAFQTQEDNQIAQDNALQEFNAYVDLLRENGIRVLVAQDTPDPHTPDSIFPNNWFTTHADGNLVIFSLFAPNRRQERKAHFIQAIQEGFANYRQTIDLTYGEEQDLFLEGTGSMVLDRIHRIAYACRSPRTHETLLKDFAERLGYTYHLFSAVDENGTQIYHTNVMMSVGTDLAIVCLDAIRNPEERQQLCDSLERTGRTVLDISLEQMRCYAGNMMELTNDRGERCWVMSATAYQSLRPEQLALLQKEHRLIVPRIDHIEKNGGGSVRCMIAEIF